MNNSNGDVDVDASMMNVDTVNDSLIEEKENDEELSHELGSTLPDDTKKSLDAVPKSEAESLSSSDDEKYDDPILIESSSDDGKKSVETKAKPRVIVESMSSSDDEKCDDPVLIESSSDDGKYDDPVLIKSSSDDGKKSAKTKSMPKVVVSSSSNDESILIESSSDNEKKPAKTKPMPKVVVESFFSSDDETNADPIVIDSFSSAMGNKSNTDPILIESSSDDGKRSVKTKLKPNLVVESSSDDDKKYIKKKPKPEIIDLDPYIKGEKRFYGGKMTDKRKEKIAAVTEEVIEQIHGSLDSMPENVVTETPDDLTVDLMLHQKHGLTWMKWRENNKAPRGGILADDMGLGKTLSMISLIVSQKNDRKNFSEVKEKLAADMKKHFSYEKDVRPGYCTLVVAPASVIYQWEKEIKDRVKPGKLKVYVFHGPRRERDPMVLARNDIVITTYNTISSELGEDKDLIGHDSDDDNDGDNWYSKAKSGSKKGISKRNTKSVLTQIGWERIVLDEAHNIKNRKSLMSKGCCRLLAFKRWALTGTPIHNELWDFYSLVKFLRISPFSDQGYWKEHMSDMSGTLG
uniref:Helicase ATP-binding domain-containing protein n=1 Tax=Panagrolaimus superbus TaxID=310955 RepID=A0A914XWQ2_9BILA